MFEDFVLPKEVEKELHDLQALLVEIPEIKRFKQIEMAIDKNHYIHEIEELIKIKQKEAAHLAYYEKWEAKKKMDEEINRLHQELEENITVIHYRQALREANVIVQKIMKQVHEEVVRPLEHNDID